MKTKSLRITLVAGGIAGSAVIISCVCQGPGSGGGDKIIFEEDRIFIPGNNISAKDQAAMNKVLEEFDKSLYRVQTYRGGEIAETVGTIGPQFLPLVLVQKVVENAKLHSLTGTAIQAGRGCSGASGQDASGGEALSSEAGARPGGSKFSTPSPPPLTARVGAKFHIFPLRISQKFRHNDKELVRRLRPILEKYNNKP